MKIGPDADCPLPDHPELQKYSVAFEASKQFAMIFDDQWRLTYMTSDLRTSWSSRVGGNLAALAIGQHLFSANAAAAAGQHRFGLNSPDLWRRFFQAVGPFVLGHTPGGAAALQAAIDPTLRDLLDGLGHDYSSVAEFPASAAGLVGVSDGHVTAMVLRDISGKTCGFLLLFSMAAGMNALSGLAFSLDMPLVRRMEQMKRADQRPAALLFADLEGSTALAAKLGAADYFALGRRLVQAADRCVADAGGLIGRHVGDGIVAFFAVENFGSNSDAAHACISAARNLRAAITGIAARSGLTTQDVVLRFGLHWGSSVFLGRITTVARTEVTALGNEVNEATRIEPCATGGRTLASMALMNELDGTAAASLGLDLSALRYTRLADLQTATEKARKDAPDLSVCEI